MNAQPTDTHYPKPDCPIEESSGCPTCWQREYDDAIAHGHVFDGDTSCWYGLKQDTASRREHYATRLPLCDVFAERAASDATRDAIQNACDFGIPAAAEYAAAIAYCPSCGQTGCGWR